MKYEINKKRLIMGICLVLILLFSIIIVIKILTKEKLEEINVIFPSRIEKLEKLDTGGLTKYGWLQVQGTLIDVPIIMPVANDNDVDFDYGWISTASVGYKTRQVLVGHNVLNVSNTPMVNNEIFTSFEDLMAFVYYDFAKENLYLSYTEYGEDKIYVIYSIGFYDYGYDQEQGLSEKDDIKNYIKEVKENSIYKYGVDINENDNLLTVKTCTRYFGLDTKQQLVIDARELREDEKIYKYSVKKTKLYKEYKLSDHYTKNNNSL